MTDQRAPAWRLLFLLLTMVAFAGLLLAAACGGDDDDDSGGDDGGATATDDSGDDGGDDGGEPTETDDSGDDGGDDGGETDPFAELDELTSDLESITGQISYDITSTDGTTSSMTFYAKPPNSRYDSSDGSTTSTVIYTPETTYICDSSTESCFSTPGSGDSSAAGLLGAFLSPDVLQAYVGAAELAGLDVNISDESFNGIDAQCFAWDEDTEDGINRGKFCFSNDGVLVYEEFVDDSGTTTLEATAYSSDVDDSAFEPPYDVTDLET
jgi:outer membrane lipoprotein-sorting protein